MARNNSGGGAGPVIIIVLLILAAVLYQCNGAKYGLPVLPMGGATSASSASGAGSVSGSSDDSATASGTVSGTASDSAEASAEASSESAPGGFTFLPATDLIPGSWTSNGSTPDYTAYDSLANWAPSMCFPTDEAAYANSQVFNSGGSNYPTRGATNNGPACADANYSYPWRDNFCEYRGVSDSTRNVLCHSGYGHQGQDIRPATCAASVHWAVAAEDATIKDIGSYTLTLRATHAPYRVYRYLHMNPEFRTHWHIGDAVRAGEKVGRVANFGLVNGVIKPYTTVHLHFEIRLDVAETIGGELRPRNTFVPPYNALVAAYQRKMAGTGCATSEW